MPLHLATLPPPGWMNEGILTEVILNLEPPLALDLLTSLLVLNGLSTKSPRLAGHQSSLLGMYPHLAWGPPPGLPLAVLALLAQLSGGRKGSPWPSSWHQGWSRGAVRSGQSSSHVQSSLIWGEGGVAALLWWCPWRSSPSSCPGRSSSTPPGAGNSHMFKCRAIAQQMKETRRCSKRCLNCNKNKI